MYLHALELAARVRLGKEVEQWLSYERVTDCNFIRWLVIGKDNNQFTVTYHESFDDGDSDFHDVHEFSALNSEETPHGITDEFDSIVEAVAFATEKYGADANKFIVGNMIQKEYENHLCRSKSQP